MRADREPAQSESLQPILTQRQADAAAQGRQLDPQARALDAGRLRGLALEAGFTEASLLPLPMEQGATADARLEEFVAAGFAGQMEYLARRDEQGRLVRGRLERPFPWARSVLLCMASYHGPAPRSVDAAAEGAGWIARYAWTARREPDGSRRASDYHKVLLKRLRSVEATLHAEMGEFQSRAYVDTGPLLERAAAAAAGLGWVGKNTCLIHPRHGSYTFLAALVLELPVAGGEAPLTVPDRCGSCTRCLDACPTGALIGPRQMDATRCIAYLTIEHRGMIPPELAAGVGRQVFGCDICQDVCPWNRKAPVAQDAQLETRAELVNPQLEWLAGLGQAEFEALFNGSPVRRTGYRSLLRNVAIAMGNSGLGRYVPWLRAQLEEPALEQDGGLEQAVRWALSRLGAGQEDG